MRPGRPLTVPPSPPSASHAPPGEPGAARPAALPVPPPRAVRRAGGGQDPGEKLEDTARREIAEETGLVVDEIGCKLWTRESRFTYRGRVHHRLDHVYLARTDHDAPQVALRHTANERAGLIERRWWPAASLADCADKLLPAELPDLLERSSTVDSRALLRHSSPDVVATAMNTQRSGSTHRDPRPERLSHRPVRQRGGPPVTGSASYRRRDERATVAEPTMTSDNLDIVEGGSPTRDADAERRGCDLRAGEVEVDLTGQCPGRWRADDEEQSVAEGGVERPRARHVEVSPFGEAPLGGVTGLVGAADLAQRGVQPVAMAVGRELVVKIEVQPMPAQAGSRLAGRRPERKQLAELVSRA
jgi:ADP-ribose pyrophosphatase YjhB (NUDIX family)